MIKFFHRLLNPHCPDCIHEQENALVCKSCEILKQLNDYLRMDNQRLFNSIFNKNESNKTQTPAVFEPLQPQRVPWAVRRQMLEEENKIKNQIFDKSYREINDLEKELKLDSLGDKPGDKNAG